MKIVILSGGSGNDALVKGLEKFVGNRNDFDIKVIVNAYDNGKSTGVCRAVTNTLGVSDIRKNHSRMYEAIYGDNVDENLKEFYHGRYDFTKGNELNEVKNLLEKWNMPEYIPYAERFFALPKAKDFEYKDFSVSNIVYAEMYREIGYEATNKHFCDRMNIDDFVILNSFDNVYIKALTQSGYLIPDEGETVFWNNEKDKIIKTVFDVENGSFGLNQRAIDAVKNADLILVSTGTFWSSIQPTIEYLNFAQYINQSKAKKIWLFNNEKDGDSWGVNSLEFIKFMEQSGLDLTDFTLLMNTDANPLLRMTDDKHTFAFESMGNEKGKHIPVEFAKGVFATYYGLSQDFDKIVFDFDDTIFARNASEDVLKTSIENIKNINSNFADKAVIVSGNSYQSIREKLVHIFGENLADFRLPIWADANAILYINDKPVDEIKEFALSKKSLEIINQFVQEYNLQDKTTMIGNENVYNVKIKPLATKERETLIKIFENYGDEDSEARMTGKTTVDILNKSNNKANILLKISEANEKVLFVGDENADGNDKEIAKQSTYSINVGSVNETNLLIKLLEAKDDSRINNLSRQSIKI